MKSPLQLLRPLIFTQLTTTLFSSALLAVLAGPQLGASFALGSIIIMVSLLGISWAWWRILEQKRIAWTVLIIVIKYAVLLGAIFVLSRQPWFVAEGVGLGIASLAFSALVMALFTREKEKN